MAYILKVSHCRQDKSTQTCRGSVHSRAASWLHGKHALLPEALDMLSVDAADAVDVEHLVTHLLLQILPSASDENPAQPTSVGSEAHDETGKVASKQLEAREQAGCDLWDMTSSEGPARVAVQHAALEMLPKVATEAISQGQSRVAELLIGALANILCHRTLAEQAAQHLQLRLDALDITFSTTDVACLAETFRLLTTALRGPGSSEWLVTILQSPRSVLQHLVWIADNTLHATLQERSLDLLLAIACDCDHALQQMLEAGAMPVIINAITSYAESVKKASALQPNADREAREAADGPSSSNNEVFSSVPTPSVVLAALTLCQVLGQESENPLFCKHSSTLCAMVIQLLKVHELLHSRASMQGLLVLILACVDSSLWLDSLVSNAVVLEAVFEVLANECGFEEEAEEEEALQAQEAAWAVLAAVSRQAANADIAMQCLTAHIDTLTSRQLAELSPEFAKYVQTTLLQTLEQAVPLHDSQQQKAQEALRLALRENLTQAHQGAS